MTLTQFQAAYGEKWAELVKSPMWNAALDLCDSQTKILDVSRLSAEEINNFSAVIVARQQGYTEHARLLTKLQEIPDLTAGEPPAEEYPDQLEEFEESLKNQKKEKS